MLGHEPDSRDVAIRDRMGGDIYDKSLFHRARMQRAGIGKGQIRRGDDLRRLPPMGLDDVPHFSHLLLQPHAGDDTREMQRYWPIHWIPEGNLPLGYSFEDMRLLGDLGARVLEAAGVRTSDVIINLLPPGPSREYWQFALGAINAGISSFGLPPGAPPDQMDRLSPTVMVGQVGDAYDVLRAADLAGNLDRIHTVVAVGAAQDGPEWEWLVQKVGLAGVVRSWAPPGILALWGSCRGGDGFHTWPDVEFVEVTDALTGFPAPEGEPGQLIWTGTGWYATALVRLVTGFAVRLLQGPCPSCGRRSDRLLPASEVPAFPRVLDDDPHITSWISELQLTSMGEELVIWIALDEAGASLATLERIGAEVGPARVLIVEPDEISRRASDAKGERFSDRRALVQDS